MPRQKSIELGQVHGEVDGLEESTIIENNFTSIFPGEEKIFKVLGKRNGLNQVEATSDLKIVWKHLNSTEE
ncbi:MAG: hypothetical protein H7X94_15130 [Vallitaleaceae bacterium]|nr:hypothetical protein [Vallitaleaceae bacterium]